MHVITLTVRVEADDKDVAHIADDLAEAMEDYADWYRGPIVDWTFDLDTRELRDKVAKEEEEE